MESILVNRFGSRTLENDSWLQAFQHNITVTDFESQTVKYQSLNLEVEHK